MSIHAIRLAGPWELQVEGADPVRVRLPSEAPSNGRLIRKFHRPGGLDEGSEVRIELTSEKTHLVVRLNDHVLSAVAESPLQFNVTSLLQPFNSLCIQSVDEAAAILQSATMLILEAE